MVCLLQVKGLNPQTCPSRPHHFRVQSGEIPAMREHEKTFTDTVLFSLQSNQILTEKMTKSYLHWTRQRCYLPGQEYFGRLWAPPMLLMPHHKPQSSDKEISPKQRRGMVLSVLSLPRGPIPWPEHGRWAPSNMRASTWNLSLSL